MALWRADIALAQPCISRTRAGCSFHQNCHKSSPQPSSVRRRLNSGYRLRRDNVIIEKEPTKQRMLGQRWFNDDPTWAKLNNIDISKKTRYVDPMSSYGWFNVADNVPALNQHCDIFLLKVNYCIHDSWRNGSLLRFTHIPSISNHLKLVPVECV